MCDCVSSLTSPASLHHRPYFRQGLYDGGERGFLGGLSAVGGTGEASDRRGVYCMHTCVDNDVGVKANTAGHFTQWRNRSEVAMCRIVWYCEVAYVRGLILMTPGHEGPAPLFQNGLQ